MISVEMTFNALKVKFGGITHLRLDATKYIGHQSWREGYGNRKFVIVFTTTAGEISSEYDTEEKWRLILEGLDHVLDAPTRSEPTIWTSSSLSRPHHQSDNSTQEK